MLTNYEAIKDFKKREEKKKKSAKASAESKKDFIIRDIFSKNSFSIYGLCKKHRMSEITLYKSLERWGINIDEIIKSNIKQKISHRNREIATKNKGAVLDRLMKEFPDTFLSICKDFKIQPDRLKAEMYKLGITNIEEIIRDSQSRRYAEKSFKKICIYSVISRLTSKNPERFCDICSSIGVNPGAVYAKAEKTGDYDMLCKAVASSKAVRNGDRVAGKFVVNKLVGKTSKSLLSRKWV